MQYEFFCFFLFLVCLGRGKIKDCVTFTCHAPVCTLLSVSRGDRQFGGARGRPY